MNAVGWLVGWLVGCSSGTRKGIGSQRSREQRRQSERHQSTDGRTGTVQYKSVRIRIPLDSQPLSLFCFRLLLWPNRSSARSLRAVAPSNSQTFTCSTLTIGCGPKALQLPSSPLPLPRNSALQLTPFVVVKPCSRSLDRDFVGFGISQVQTMTSIFF